MKVYTLHTEVSEYRARRDQSGNWTILSRNGDESYRGEVVSGDPEAASYEGRRLHVRRNTPFFESTHYNTFPITQVVPDPDLVDRNMVLDEFDQLATIIDDLGRDIGFEGINRKAGMDSVAAVVADLRRAIVRA